MDIEKQVFDRDRLGGGLLVSGDVTANQLNQVIEHEAEGELKDGRFRRAADQALQVKDFGDFLKDLLNAPALQVVVEQLRGWIKLGIQEVSDQRHLRLARTLQRDLPDISPFGMIDRSQPTPLFPKSSALGVDPQSPWAVWIGVKANLGMPADEKVIPTLSKFLEAIEIAKAAVRQKQEQAFDFAANLRQQIGNEPHVVGIAILVGTHADHQARFIVHRHQSPASQHSSRYLPEQLQPLGHPLDRFAVQGDRVHVAETGRRLPVSLDW